MGPFPPGAIELPQAIFPLDLQDPEILGPLQPLIKNGCLKITPTVLFDPAKEMKETLKDVQECRLGSCEDLCFILRELWEEPLLYRLTGREWAFMAKSNVVFPQRLEEFGLQPQDDQVGMEELPFHSLPEACLYPVAFYLEFSFQSPCSLTHSERVEMQAAVYNDITPDTYCFYVRNDHVYCQRREWRTAYNEGTIREPGRTQGQGEEEQKLNPK